MNSFEMIIRYWLRSKKNFWLGFIFQAVSTVFALFTPIFLGRLVGSLNTPADTRPSAGLLWFYALIIIIFAFFTFLAGKAGRIYAAEVSSNALYALRADINDALYRQSFSYFDKNETGQLIARATSDVDQSEMIFGFGLAVGLQGVIQLSGVLISAYFLAPRLAWIFWIAIPASLGISIFFSRILRPIYHETRYAFGEMTNTIRENIVGAQVVRIFNAQPKERQKFTTNNQSFYKASLKSVRYNTLFMPFNMVLIAFMVITVLYVGGGYVMDGSMALETLIALQSFVGIAIFPLVMMGQILIMYIQADASLTRVRDVLESVPDVKDVPDAIPIENMKGAVGFERVGFGYTSSNRILHDISFKVSAGKKIAIIGTTGSGKSTIINLLPRFYDVNEGTITIDDIDIRRYLLKDLRKNIGIVSQETYLFNKTIAENIAFGKEEASIAEITEAAKIANLHEFIVSLPEGYDTVIGERGTRLSGGQKQRLSIARALIIRPKILIFDDSTSSVDVETEFKIQQALDKIMEGTTTFIITQRVSAIRNADLIAILDKGRLVGLGVHDELIKSNVLYRQIYETLNQKQHLLGKAGTSTAIKEGGN
jgi:ATP-binding cassette subfamily B protein